MTLIILAIVIGFIIGKYQLLPNSLLRYTDYLISFGVFVLLFSMGIQIGLEDDLISKLGVLGWQAFVLASLAIFFSVIIIHFLVNRLIDIKKDQERGVE